MLPKKVKGGAANIWLACSYHPILDNNGHIYRTVMYGLDVSERVGLTGDVQRMDAFAQVSDAAIRDLNALARSPSVLVRWWWWLMAVGRWYVQICKQLTELLRLPQMLLFLFRSNELKT